MVNKVDNIKSFIRKERIDILVIVETWLQPGDTVAIRPVAVDIRNNRRDVNVCRGSGGIMVITNNNYKNRVKIKEISDNNNWVRLEIDEITVVCTYLTPTVVQDEVDDFWNRMEILAQRDEDLIILGDFNSRMGQVTGDHYKNSRGRRLIEFLPQSSMEIRLPEIGKWTTYSYKGRGITDLVITKRNGGERISSLRVVEDATLGGSDHRPLIMTVNNNKEVDINVNNRWNLNKLRKDNIRDNYQNSLAVDAWKINRLIDDTWNIVNNKMQRKLHMNKGDREEIINRLWNEIKNWIISALTRSCGQIVEDIYTNKDFMTNKMLEMEKEIDNARKDAQSAVDKGASPIILRSAWRKYGKLRTQWKKRHKKRKEVVYRRTIDLLNFPEEQGTFMKVISAIKKREGKTTSRLDPDDMEDHRDHFLTTFGGNPTGNEELVDIYLLNDTNDTNNIIPYNIRGITTGKIRQILADCPLGKAAGIDGLPGEVWKWGGETIIEPLCGLFSLCESLIVIPSDWKRATIAPIYKNKGDNTHISNYRPIAITCVARRLYEKIVCRHFGNMVEDNIVTNQGGFRRNKSTYDQILRLHEIIVNNKSGLLTFLDIKAAYDCVDRRILWSDIYNKFKVSKRTIQILRSLFDNNSSRLMIGGKESDDILNKRGLLQGSSLSPCLFNVFINSLSNLLNDKEDGLESKGERINNLLYADDTVLLSSSTENTQVLLNACDDWSKGHGIEFAPTKCAIIQKNIDDDTTNMLYNTPVNVGKTYTYLGLIFDMKGINWELSMKKRIEGAINRIHWMGRKGMNAFGWRPMMSLSIYKSYIRPMIEYGLALQILPKKVLTDLQRVQNMALRRMTSVNRTTSVAALHTIYGLESMEERNHNLTMKYFNKAINGDKKTHTVGKVIAKEMNLAQKRLKGGSLVNKFKRQCKWKDKVVKEGGKITKIDIKRSQEDSIFIFRTKGGKVSNRLDIRGIGKANSILTNAIELPRLHVYLLIQWLVGKSTSYKIYCKICGINLHDDHLLECGGAKTELTTIQNNYNIIIGSEYYTLRERLDRLLTLVARKQVFLLEAYKDIAKVLLECKIRTMGWENREKDTYSDDDDPMEPLNNRLTVRLKIQNSKRRRKT